MECHTTLERRARKAKEKCTRDSDSNPGAASRDVLGDTAIGVGELDTKKRSVGSNKNTRRALISPQDTSQGDIREWTHSAEKGQGHSQPKGKGKGKGKEKTSQEKGTTTRTKLDLRMKKLDSAGWTILVYNVREWNLSVMSKSTVMILKRPEWIEQLTFFVITSAKAS